MKTKIRNALENMLLDMANAYLESIKEKIKAEKAKRNQFSDFEDLK